MTVSPVKGAELKCVSGQLTLLAIMNDRPLSRFATIDWFY